MINFLMLRMRINFHFCRLYRGYFFFLPPVLSIHEHLYWDNAVPTKLELERLVKNTLDAPWNMRQGQVIPSTETVTLKDGAVKVDAAFLYADLAETSYLAQVCPWETTAKIIRAYLDCSVRIIKSWGGEIRSFDGDRVMGVFIGNMKNTHASKCAREIFYTVENILAPAALQKFKSFQTHNIKLKNCVGVDVGRARAVRAGIRDSNDLIWIGKAPSFAAKLSDIRNYGYCVYISKASYSCLDTDAKIANGKNIWVQDFVSFAGAQEEIYRSKFMLKP
jgi:adenylate cyclase